jgi:hypothetical protein
MRGAAGRALGFITAPGTTRAAGRVHPAERDGRRAEGRGPPERRRRHGRVPDFPSDELVRYRVIPVGRHSVIGVPDPDILTATDEHQGVRRVRTVTLEQEVIVPLLAAGPVDGRGSGTESALDDGLPTAGARARASILVDFFTTEVDFARQVFQTAEALSAGGILDACLRPRAAAVAAFRGGGGLARRRGRCERVQEAS